MIIKHTEFRTVEKSSVIKEWAAHIADTLEAIEDKVDDIGELSLLVDGGDWSYQILKDPTYMKIKKIVGEDVDEIEYEDLVDKLEDYILEGLSEKIEFEGNVDFLGLTFN